MTEVGGVTRTTTPVTPPHCASTGGVQIDASGPWHLDFLSTKQSNRASDGPGWHMQVLMAALAFALVTVAASFEQLLMAAVTESQAVRT